MPSTNKQLRNVIENLEVSLASSDRTNSGLKAKIKALEQTCDRLRFRLRQEGDVLSFEPRVKHERELIDTHFRFRHEVIDFMDARNLSTHSLFIEADIQTLYIRTEKATFFNCPVYYDKPTKTIRRQERVRDYRQEQPINMEEKEMKLKKFWMVCMEPEEASIGTNSHGIPCMVSSHFIDPRSMFKSEYDATVCARRLSEKHGSRYSVLEATRVVHSYTSEPTVTGTRITEYEADKWVVGPDTVAGPYKNIEEAEEEAKRRTAFTGNKHFVRVDAFVAARDAEPEDQVSIEIL